MIKNETIQHLYLSFKQHYILQYFFPNIYHQMTLLNIKGQKADIRDEIQFLHRILRHHNFFIFYETIRLFCQVFQTYKVFDFFHDDLVKKFQKIEKTNLNHQSTDFIEEYLLIHQDPEYIQSYIIKYLCEQQLMQAQYIDVIHQHPAPDLLFKLFKQLLSTPILINEKRAANLERIMQGSPELIQVLLKRRDCSQQEFDETCSFHP
jgi:hypothetical protein